MPQLGVRDFHLATRQLLLDAGYSQGQHVAFAGRLFHVANHRLRQPRQQGGQGNRQDIVPGRESASALSERGRSSRCRGLTRSGGCGRWRRSWRGWTRRDNPGRSRGGLWFVPSPPKQFLENTKHSMMICWAPYYSPFRGESSKKPILTPRQPLGKALPERPVSRRGEASRYRAAPLIGARGTARRSFPRSGPGFAGAPSLPPNR